MNDNFFNKILPHIHGNDSKVKRTIEFIQSQLKDKKIDIVLFHQGQNGRGLDRDCKEGEELFFTSFIIWAK